MIEIIKPSLKQLESYIESNNYKGYDPYDALKSPLFDFPFFKSNKLFRFLSQQFVRRFPINLRPLLKIQKGYNPVTLGLSIQGYAYLYQVEENNKDYYKERIFYLVDELKTLIPDGFSGACWGYDFFWEARYSKISDYQPTVVATGIITNALFEVYRIFGDKETKKLLISSADFVVNDLQRTYKGDSVCFSYSPFDMQQVLNASMKGVRLLSQVYFITKNDELKELASNAVKFVIDHQRGDGSWGYRLKKGGGWSDNYHTGYILDCLDAYTELTGDNNFELNIKKGYYFYKNNFITPEGIPKFYNNKIYPIDCTSAAQSILTTIRFKDIEIAEKVAAWMLKNMQKENGSFKFRKFKYYTVPTSFMRWSDAWMFAALSFLILNKNK